MDLKVVANGEDPTRPTIAATSNRDLAQMNKIPDWLGWNIYPGWYPGWGPVDNFGVLMDEGRTMSRQGGLCISEYGAGANPNQHEENPSQPRPDGPWHPEEYQSILHENAWLAMRARPFVWGTFVWNMFDFTVNTRREGGVIARNDKGLVTYDRKTRKDAFYFYKANWNPDLMVYITSRRFTERTNAVTPVKIYSNAADVELLVNGEKQARGNISAPGVFVWNKIQLKPGANHLEARVSRKGLTIEETATDECVWNLK
jgi:beta-galactosidase